MLRAGRLSGVDELERGVGKLDADLAAASLTEQLLQLERVVIQAAAPIVRGRLFAGDVGFGPRERGLVGASWNGR